MLELGTQEEATLAEEARLAAVKSDGEGDGATTDDEYEAAFVADRQASGAAGGLPRHAAKRVKADRAAEKAAERAALANMTEAERKAHAIAKRAEAAAKAEQRKLHVQRRKAKAEAAASAQGLDTAPRPPSGDARAASLPRAAAAGTAPLMGSADSRAVSSASSSRPPYDGPYDDDDDDDGAPATARTYGDHLQRRHHYPRDKALGELAPAPAGGVPRAGEGEVLAPLIALDVLIGARLALSIAARLAPDWRFRLPLDYRSIVARLQEEDIADLTPSAAIELAVAEEERAAAEVVMRQSWLVGRTPLDERVARLLEKYELKVRWRH